MTLVVDVELVVHGVFLQLGHEPRDVDYCHRNFSPLETAGGGRPLHRRFYQDAKKSISDADGPLGLGAVDRDAVLSLFDDLVSEIREVLDGLDDWGLSGERPSQYRHDVVVDEIVVPRLRSAGLAVLSEESGLVGDDDVVVVVDPVDGSTNGSRRIPWFATSLCAVDDHGPVAAVVANLASNRRYRAVRGEGFEVSEGRLLGTDYGRSPFGTTSCERLDEAIIGFSGLPPSHGGWNQFRAFGAAALDLCAVATGSLDGYVDVDRAHGVWDYLGGVLVCREAGGFAADSHGDELITLDPTHRRAPVAAATPELLDELLAMTAAWRSGGRGTGH